MAARARAFAGALVVCTAACSAPEPDEPARATTSSRLIGGMASDGSQNETVLLIHHARDAEVNQVCSGTLLAPNLVLTARHCVAATDPTSACLSDASAVQGAGIYDDYDPSDLYVFAGAERPASLADVVQRGSAIIDDGATTLCNHDLALVLLATAVPNAKLAPVRLDGGAATTEPVTLVGWGITDATARVPTTRQQRADTAILAVGPSAELGLGSAELEVGEGPCEGDSGGPALSSSGAVIGALSRGGNGTDEAGIGACTAGTSIYTRAAGFRELVLSAYERAGQVPWLEGESSPGVARAESTARSSEGGCAVGTAPSSTTAGALVVVLGAIIERRRRREVSLRAPREAH